MAVAALERIRVAAAEALERIRAAAVEAQEKHNNNYTKHKIVSGGVRLSHSILG